jgi:hypothetical protein
MIPDFSHNGTVRHVDDEVFASLAVHPGALPGQTIVGAHSLL